MYINQDFTTVFKIMVNESKNQYCTLFVPAMCLRSEAWHGTLWLKKLPFGHRNYGGCRLALGAKTLAPLVETFLVIAAT
mgnify:CR=1 FL=1